MVSSTSFSFASESRRMLSTTTFSERSRMPPTVLSRDSWISSRRGLSFSTSFAALAWTRICMSRKRMADFTAAWTSAAADSAAFKHFWAFSLLSSPSAGGASMAAESSVNFWNFSSTAATFAAQSSKLFFAASRESTEAVIFLNLPISVATVRSRASYLISSLLISLEASLPFASICLAVMNLRVSARCLLASCSALMVASEAALISSTDSFVSLSSSRLEAASATF
mmetsp:Transcript_5440/g.12586  ORF Transcript_5440/g.12586 Transcript_5440/m.12586 type:complete len:227 (-) Transcript_5440:1362-2042(-)